MSKNKKIEPMFRLGIERKCAKCGRKVIKFFNFSKNEHSIMQIDKPYICDGCQVLETKMPPIFNIERDRERIKLMEELMKKNEWYVPTLCDVSAKLEQFSENNDKDSTDDCNDKIWEQFELIKDKCDKTPIKPMELTVDGVQNSYVNIITNPNKCPICDKEYRDSEFICAIEHGTIQLKNICVDCYNKIFKRKE